MYTVAGDGPCNEELALRIQAGDKNAAERLVSQNEGYLTELARAYTPWCEMEVLKQEAALALLDAAGHFDPTHGTKPLTYATPVMEAALSDYAARHAFPLSVPASRGSQLRTVAHLCAEGWDASDAELVKAVYGELNVSATVAGALIKEYRTLFCVRQLGDDVFSVSCGGDPAVVYDRHMRRTLLMQRIGEVLTPRELNLVRSYHGIGQPDEVGMTFQELAIYLNYNGPSGAEKAYKAALRKLKRAGFTAGGSPLRRPSAPPKRRWSGLLGMAQRRREHGGRSRRWQIDLSVRQQRLSAFTRCSADLNQKLFHSRCNKSSFPCITRMTGDGSLCSVC